jgi:hypothetical protein
VTAEIETLIRRERPGWQVVTIVEVNDESGPSYEVSIEQGSERKVVLISPDLEIAGERPTSRP